MKPFQSVTTLLPLLFAIMFGLVGCDTPQQEIKKAKASSIIGKTTQAIGQYDPNGGAVIADQQVKGSANPLAAAGAYGFAAGKISKLEVEKAIQLFHATNGRYPKDHAEFMEEIIIKNNMQLPVLPGGDQYQYDVANHVIVIVEGKKDQQD